MVTFERAFWFSLSSVVVCHESLLQTIAPLRAFSPLLKKGEKMKENSPEHHVKAATTSTQSKMRIFFVCSLYCPSKEGANWGGGGCVAFQDPFVHSVAVIEVKCDRLSLGLLDRQFDFRSFYIVWFDFRLWFWVLKNPKILLSLILTWGGTFLD